MLDLGTIIEHADGFVGEQQPTHDAIILGVDLTGLHRVVIEHQKAAGCIAGGKFLSQTGFDERTDHESIELHWHDLSCEALEFCGE